MSTRSGTGTLASNIGNPIPIMSIQKRNKQSRQRRIPETKLDRRRSQGNLMAYNSLVKLFQLSNIWSWPFISHTHFSDKRDVFSVSHPKKNDKKVVRKSYFFKSFGWETLRQDKVKSVLDKVKCIKYFILLFSISWEEFSQLADLS